MSDKEMSKRQQRKEQIRRKEKNSRLMSIGLVTVGVIFLAILFIWPQVKPIDAVVSAPEVNIPVSDFNTAGNPDAPIRIDEYADFQCPYCRRFFENTEALLMNNYVANGTVYFVYHSFGEFIGPESSAAAEAAYCAGDQNKFWQMSSTLYANQTGENVGAFNDRRIQAFAELIELNMEEFNSCLDTNKYADLIKQDGEDALAAGIQATPSFVLTYTVNGEVKTKQLQGAQSYEVFQQEIEAALAEMNK
ncbi:MAG: DSBA oxidoreductase [Chloroflexi bacterium OLB14]|nr:MAG: DSBA oxidoreductase [Chloroflexi bacterium OLB14]